MKHIQSYIKVTVGIFLVFTIVSCSPEKKLAIEFASNTNAKNVLVLTPDHVFKSNLKTYLIDSLGITNHENKDSILLNHSKYLSDLNDSLFLANYILGFSKALNKYGFKVFNQNEVEKFLMLDSNTYQVNIAQIELEETIYTFRDEMEIYDKYYYHDHNLNAVYINSWFEINTFDEENTNQKVYFTTDMITDIPEGSFDYDIFSGKVRYLYNIDSLEQKVLYELAYRLGKEYAGYTFDFLLNKELNEEIEPGARSKNYWRYDPVNHYFYPATDDRFILLE